MRPSFEWSLHPTCSRSPGYEVVILYGPLLPPEEEGDELEDWLRQELETARAVQDVKNAVETFFGVRYPAPASVREPTSDRVTSFQAPEHSKRVS